MASDDLQDDEVVVPHRRHRASRSKWCKGVKGRKHDLAWVKGVVTRWSSITYLLQCKVCLKQLASCSGRGYFTQHPKDAPPCPIHGVLR